ncbi:hypothetical protein CYMTET_47770 [Cymbomonas tetramitiformis]|uniref:Uncharacterized protein n=1 Tax=Cymbomonas tetramitiformis TaxID=36881 RepID=A0AAE0BTP7_9CHLO|nr:hypothetical protein CYMTET_47770 [Cymbomonas tetramitiformis]|eukprot:gene9917-11743_t
MPRSDQHWMNAVRLSRAKPSASSSEGVIWITVSMIGVCVLIVTAVVLLARTDTGGIDYDQEFIMKGRSTEPPTIAPSVAPTVNTATHTVTTVAPTDTATVTTSPTAPTVAPTTANCAEERAECENYCSVDSVCTTYEASVIDESSPGNHDDCEQAMNDAKSACSA